MKIMIKILKGIFYTVTIIIWMGVAWASYDLYRSFYPPQPQTIERPGPSIDTDIYASVG